MKKPRASRIFGKSRASHVPMKTFASLLLALTLTATGLIVPGVASAASQNELLIGLSYDGTKAFDTDPLDDGNKYPGASPHTPGLDARSDNGVVRSYDLFGVRLDWNVNEDSDKNVILTATLPDKGENLEWAIPKATNPTPGNEDGLPSGCLADGSSFAGDTLTCNIGDQAEGSNGTIFADVRVKGLRDGDTISVSSTMTTTQPGAGGTVASDLPADVVVSAAPIGDWVKSDPKVIKNVSQGGDNGVAFVYPLSFDWESGAKGSETPDGSKKITFWDHPWDLPSPKLVTDPAIIGGGPVCGNLGTSGDWDCTAEPTQDGYQPIRVEITGQDTSAKNGSLKGQMAFFVAQTDYDARVALTSPKNSFFNSITGSLDDDFTNFDKGDPLAEPDPVKADDPAKRITPIKVRGTNIDTDETSVSNNTGFYFDTPPFIDPPTGGGKQLQVRRPQRPH